MSKRYRTPKAKPGELRVMYGKPRDDVPDLFYCHGGEGVGKPDARLLSHFFENVTYFDGRNLRQELEHRGYDIRTLVFSVRQKEKPTDGKE